MLPTLWSYPAMVPYMRRGDNAFRFLIVDDDPSSLTALASALSFHFPEMSVDSAGSVQESLGKVNAGKYSVVLTDLRMPGRSGLGLFQHLRQHYPSLAVLVMSGHAEEAAMSTALDYGAFAVLHKPFDREALIKTITDALATSLQHKAPRTEWDGA